MASRHTQSSCSVYLGPSTDITIDTNGLINLWGLIQEGLLRGLGGRLWSRTACSYYFRSHGLVYIDCQSKSWLFINEVIAEYWVLVNSFPHLRNTSWVLFQRCIILVNSSYAHDMYLFDIHSSPYKEQNGPKITPIPWYLNVAGDGVMVELSSGRVSVHPTCNLQTV